jgi:hypothetical protein
VFGFTQLRAWQVSILLGALAAFVGILKYGVGVFPSWIYMYDLSVNWFDPSQSPLLTPPADYLKSNFVAAWLAGLLGFNTVAAHFAFHIFAVVVAIMLPFFMPKVRSSIYSSRLMFIAVAGGGIMPILLLWANGYDAVTVIGIGFAATCLKSYWGALGWFIAALNHPSLGFVAFVAWALILLWDSRSLVRAATSGVGLISGILLNEVLMNTCGGSTSRIDWFVERSFDEFVRNFFSSMPLVLFGSLGVLWLVLLRPEVLKVRMVRILVVEAVTMSIVLPWISLDSSRTVSICLFGALLLVVTTLPERVEGSVIGSTWQTLGVAAVIVPVPTVWSGALLYGGWESFFGLDTSLLPPDGYSVSN